MASETGTRDGWQCPGCRTYYSPDVEACRCASGNLPLSERLKRARQPIRLGGGTMRFPSSPLSCTCPSVWGGITPPPACPVHGQTEMLQVRC